MYRLIKDELETIVAGVDSDLDLPALADYFTAPRH